MADLNLRLFFYSPWTEKLLPLVLVCLLALAVFPLLFSPSDPSRRRLRIALALGGIGSFVISWQMIYIDHDEVEHLHSAWLLSQGLLPFRDFWQHHLPTLWILLAPITAWFDAGSSLVETARLGCLLVAVTSGFLAWRTSLELHPDKDISWPVYFFFWSAMLIPFQWNVLRPDLVAVPLILVGLWLLLSTGEAGWKHVLAGLCFGGALSLTPKLLLLVACAGTAGVLRRPFSPGGALLHRALPLSGGVATALLPLLLWLRAHDLVGPCHSWVFTFNRKLQELVISEGAILPIACIVSALFFRSVYRQSDEERISRANIITAAILGGSIPMLISPAKVLYHLQLTALLVLIALAPAATTMFRRLAAERRHVLMAFVCVMFLLPAHSYTRTSALSPFSEGLVQMDILQAYARKGAISLMFPCHPILARNATGFDHGWLWEFLKLPILHEDLRKPIGSFTEQLMARQPILIAPQRRTCSPYAETERNALSDHLLNTGFIGKAEHDQLQGFLDKRYRLVNIMNGWFWLRNDIQESNY